MELNDFSSLIEVAVALNIAFVAVEYVKTYTKVLCNQVFKLHDFIAASYMECMQSLVDEETLSHIRPNKIGENKNTNNLIEKAKREREKIRKEIDTEKETFSLKIENVCEAKNVSAISLWLFFYGLVALFLFGLKLNPCREYIFWSFLSLSTFIYVLIGWFFNNKSKSVFQDYSSLRHAIIWFSIVLIICLIPTLFLGSYLSPIIDYIWPFVLFLSLSLMYSNFVAAVIKVWNKADNIRKEIKASSEQIKNRCSTLQGDVNKLINVNEVCDLLDLEPDN